MVKRSLARTAARHTSTEWISRRFQRLQNYLLLGTTAIALAIISAPPGLAATKIAGFFGLPIPDLPIPGGSVEDLLKGAIVDQAVKALGSTLTNEAPIESSSQATFPIVNQLPGTAFKPQAMPTTLIAQLRNAADGTVALQPGDYRIPVNVFCMKVSAHSPAGHRYLLAPLKGKWADIIVALNARSAASRFCAASFCKASQEAAAGIAFN